MNTSFLALVISLAMLSAGCVTTGAKDKAGADKKIKTYSADLNGDGRAEIIEVADKLDTESVTVVTAKKQLKAKVQEKIDSFSVPGKISKLEIVELYFDAVKQIAVIFQDSNSVSHIVIYRLLNDKFSQMFKAESKYGIETQLQGAVVRIRIGKPPRGGQDSPNCVPELEDWVWTGQKFIRD